MPFLAKMSTWILVGDLAHGQGAPLLAFATWGLAMSVALAKQRLFQKGSRFELVMIGGAAIFGTVLECVQGACVPNRSADLADVAADVAGVALALLAFRVIFGCRPGRIATD